MTYSVSWEVNPESWEEMLVRRSAVSADCSRQVGNSEGVGVGSGCSVDVGSGFSMGVYNGCWQ